jgi:hypothetical protein
LEGEIKKMKKIIALILVGMTITVSLNFLNLITMTEKNMGKDLQGNNYFMEGYSKGDKVLILENSYYEVIKEIKIN